MRSVLSSGRAIAPWCASHETRTKARRSPPTAPAPESTKLSVRSWRDDAAAAGAECAAHGELFGAGGGARKQQVGEIDAGDQQNHADGGPENNERAVKPAGDIVLERNGDHGVFIVHRRSAAA